MVESLTSISPGREEPVQCYLGHALGAQPSPAGPVRLTMKGRIRVGTQRYATFFEAEITELERADEVGE